MQTERKMGREITVSAFIATTGVSKRAMKLAGRPLKKKDVLRARGHLRYISRVTFDAPVTYWP